MTDHIPEMHTTTIKADPTRPYKALAAATIAGAGVAIAQGSDVLPAWALLILAVLIAGLGTFLVPNPVTVTDE